jgi:molybdenum cofactor cytidylyltransferase
MPSRVPPNPRAVAILLAAGDSVRMGSPKALIEWQGRPLLQHQLEEIGKSRVAGCVVVLGRDAERLEPLVRASGEPGGSTRSIVNPRHAEGRCSSILAGLGALSSLPAPPEAVCIVSVDQPLAGRLLNALLDAAWREWSSGGVSRGGGEKTILVPAFQGRRGHPPLFHGSLLPELTTIREATEGLRAVIRRLPARVLEVPWDDDRILLNLNAGIDLERASDS